VPPWLDDSQAGPTRFTSAADFETVRGAKNHLRYVAQDFDTVMKEGTPGSSDKGKIYEPPDGNIIERLDLAGRDWAVYMMVIMTERGYSFTSAAESETVRDAMNPLRYVAQDFDTEMEEETPNSFDKETTYELPDGNIIKHPSELKQAGVEVAVAVEEVMSESIVKSCFTSQALDKMLALELFKKIGEGVSGKFRQLECFFKDLTHDNVGKTQAVKHPSEPRPWIVEVEAAVEEFMTEPIVKNRFTSESRPTLFRAD
jgi:hypothetical protein